MNNQSILSTIKKMLGIAEDYDAFDTDVIVNINSVLMILNQLGVGPEKPFIIYGPNEKWSDFVDKDVELVKSYIYLKVRLMFDPPSNSFLVSSMEKQISEYEWRLNVQVEDNKTTETPPECNIERISEEEIDKWFEEA